ncbi:hypothetical protein BH09SUM1_BH09SUM1_06320 [soil metagenome]
MVGPPAPGASAFFFRRVALAFLRRAVVTAAMDFSVVIVSLNGRARIAMPLDALRRCDPPAAQVIVVDNGSDDGLSEFVKKNYPEVDLVRAPQNLGFAGGNNLGIVNARGEIIVLLNDDTDPEADWLAPIAAAFAQHSRFGLAGCQLLYPDSGKVQHLGGVVHDNGLTDHAGWGGEAGVFAKGEIIPSDYVTGAAMAIRRRVLSDIGFLDAGFWPIYFEETDFCARAKRAGWEIAVVPESRVVHHESQTTGRLSPKFLRTYHRNRIRYLIKNRRVMEWGRTFRAEARWMAINAPWDHLWACALAYAWAPFQLAEVAVMRLRRARR